MCVCVCVCVCSASYSQSKCGIKTFKGENPEIRLRVIRNVLKIDTSNTLKAAMKHDGFSNFTLLCSDVVVS